jgi:hypothetical protein
MTGYGESLYGESFYGASAYRLDTELRVGITARIVPRKTVSPPLMDTLAYGLAQRFDFLQQAIQAFSLFGKIEYAKGTELDDHWGIMYELPRLTGESDTDYRARLQTYVKVLTGSGTIPNTQEVFDFLIGVPGGTRISSIWPARALIDFNNVDAMRAAKANMGLLNSVLPGMFAAGIDYELLIPYQDCYIRAAIMGTAELPHVMRTAVQVERELSCGIDALIAICGEIDADIAAAIQAERSISTLMRAAVRIERNLEYVQLAAVQGNPELATSMLAAIMSQRELPVLSLAAVQCERELSCSQFAAVARTFDLSCGILARIVYSYKSEFQVVAAVQATRELSCGIRARIARRMT